MLTIKGCCRLAEYHNADNYSLALLVSLGRRYRKLVRFDGEVHGIVGVARTSA